MYENTLEVSTSASAQKLSEQLTRTAFDLDKHKHPWETIALDLMGRHPRSDTGKKFILVVIDLFSRWVEAFPIASSKTPVLTNLLERNFSQLGISPPTPEK